MKALNLLLTILILYSSCLLIESCGTNHPGNKATIITFNDNIAPIIYKKCAACHHPGAAGPFNLLTYDDVKNHAQTIKLTVKSGEIGRAHV